MDRDIVLFYVFSQVRSGSTMFCDSLSMHPDIACPHESLNQVRLGRLTVDGLIAEIASANPNKKFIGLHGQYEQIPKELYSSPFNKILLTRKDQWKGAVDQINIHYNRNISDYDIDSPLLKKIYLERCRQHQEMEELIAETGNSLQLYIENICPLRALKFTDKSSRVIHEFLGLETQSPFTSYDMGREVLPRNFESAKHAGKS